MEFFRIFVFSLYILFLQYEFSIESVFEEIDKKRTTNSDDEPLFVARVEIRKYHKFEKYSINSLCGGAVLTQYTILTTAHCVKKLYYGKQLNYVLLDTDRISIIKYYTYKTDIIYVHDDYDPTTNPPTNDIALIKIDDDGKFGIPARSIIKINTERVPENTICKIYSSVEGRAKKTLIGYDYKAFNGSNLTVYDTANHKCFVGPHFNNLTRHDDKMKGILCAEKNDSLNTFFTSGYIGGPIVCMVNKEMRLVGVASNQYNGASYAYDNVGFFTNVTYYQTWIKEANLTSIVDKRYFPNVAIVRYAGKDRCFGTIVSKDTVLTSAHCAFDDSGNPCNVDYTIIRFFYETHPEEENYIVSMDYQVSRIEPHEYYDRTKTPPVNDIAYFIIEEQFAIKEQRIDLLQQKDLDGIPCSVFRWVPNKKYESNLKTIHSSLSVDVYNYTNCKLKYPKQMKNLTDFKNEMLCVVMKAYVNPGEYKTYYGGPLICRINDSNHLAAIGTYEIGLNELRSYENGNSFYKKQKLGVFTNVINYLRWIKDASLDYSTNYSNKHEYVVLVKDRKTSVSCAGFLVGIDVFLAVTAGHCLSSLNESEVSVLIGNVVEWKMKKYAVKKVIRHENYDPSAKPILNDIACLEIEQRNGFKKQWRIRSKEVSGNTTYQFVGWGSIQTTIHKTELMYQLQYTSAKILSKSSCGTLLNVNVTEGMICAVVPGDTCEKYSGGVLIADSTALVGIATYGLKKCSRTTPFPIIFTNVTFYENWVWSQLNPRHSSDKSVEHKFPRKDISKNSSNSNTDLNTMTQVLLILLILFSVL